MKIKITNPPWCLEDYPGDLIFEVSENEKYLFQDLDTDNPKMVKSVADLMIKQGRGHILKNEH